MLHRSLPRLEIRVPCTADWRSMEPIAGDSRARLCRRCDKPVYDSKSVTRAQLHALIVETEGALPCLQLHRRPDGTIVTKGCMSAVYRTSRALWVKAAAFAVAFWTGAVNLRSAVDDALTPPPISIGLGDESSNVLMGTFFLPAEPREPPVRPQLQKLLIGHPAPLRHLQVDDEDLSLPRGWRD